MFFLHGLGGSAESWSTQLDDFAAMARCVAWTMPGYGPSASLPKMTITTLAQAAVGLLDDLDIASATIVGHSMGGYIAQEMALTAPDRVDRLILVGTTAAFGKPGSSFNEGFLAARQKPLDEGMTPAGLAPAVVDDLVAPGTPDAVKEAAVASMAQIDSSAYRAALSALVSWDARERLPSLAVPTACIAGADDATAPPRAMQRLTDLIPGATLDVIESAGHLINMEQPERFNALLRRAGLRR